MSESNRLASSTKPDEKAAEIVADVLRAAHRVRAVLVSHYAEFGLTDVRYAVLQVISKAGAQGCSQTELADELEQSESSVSTLVDRMRSGGLIYRLRSKSDRRKRVLMLTDRARDVLTQMETVHLERTASLLSGFSAAELDFLSRLLCRLVADLCQLQDACKQPPDWTNATGKTDTGSVPIPAPETQNPAA